MTNHIKKLCIFLFLCAPYAYGQVDYSDVKLLIKIPTRTRPERFFQYLDQYYQYLSGKVTCLFLISCDIDDETMNNKAVLDRCKKYAGLHIYFGNNTNKVEAYNADIEKHLDFDILLVASDDMLPIVQDYDQIIVDSMLAAFPDLDGVLNYHDGTLGPELNTMPVIGKTYFDRFGYVYHPAYQSLACDNELTAISKILKKEKYIPHAIIKHKHPVWEHTPQDALLIHNEAIGRKYDIDTFNQRRSRNFDIPLAWLEQATPKIWSILICTRAERTEHYKQTYQKLIFQIKALGLEDKIEVLSFLDNHEYSMSYKRNLLMEQSNGKYVCFVEDTGVVGDDYIKRIYQKLHSQPDCVQFVGTRIAGSGKQYTVIHSMNYNAYCNEKKMHYGPPDHLNPMRRDIAVQFMFPELHNAKDANRALIIAEKQLIKSEASIDTNKPYYFYL